MSLGQRIPQRSIENKIRKTPTKGNPCSKKRHQGKKGERERWIVWESSNKQGNGHVVIRNSEPLNAKYVRERERERGGKIVRVTPAQTSTKTKLRGELFN